MHLNDAGLMIDKWWQKIPEKFPDIELGQYQIMPNHFHAIITNVGADPCVRPDKHDENPEHIHTENKPEHEITTNENKTENPAEQSAIVPLGLEGEHNPIENKPEHEIKTYQNETENPAEKTAIVSLGQEGEHIHTENKPEHEIKTNQNKTENPAEQSAIVPLGLEGEHMGSPLRAVTQWFKTMSTNEYIRHVKQNDWPPFNGKLWQRNYYEHIIRNEYAMLRIAAYILDNPVNWDNDSFFI